MDIENVEVFGNSHLGGNDQLDQVLDPKSEILQDRQKGLADRFFEYLSKNSTNFTRNIVC